MTTATLNTAPAPTTTAEEYDLLRHKLYWTPEEFCIVAGIGRSTTYELLRRGEIPSVRLGRQYRIPRAVLDALAN